MSSNDKITENYATAWMEVARNGDMGFFERQFSNPYRNTVAFCDWLESQGCLNFSRESSIIDIGSGMGGGLYYLSQRFPKVKFTGIEINSELVKMGRDKLEKYKVNNIDLRVGDIYALDDKYIGQYDGLITMQTLHVLPEFEIPLEMMTGLSPQWIAFNTLMYEGDINCKIETYDYTMPTKDKPYNRKFHNVYSLSLVRKFLEKRGYEKFFFSPFEIDIDLPKPETKGFGTYTVKTQDNKRLQISGPLLMSWYFVLAKRG